MWSAFNGPSARLIGHDHSESRRLGPPRSHVSGTLFVEGYTLEPRFYDGLTESEELDAIPYSYTFSH